METNNTSPPVERILSSIIERNSTIYDFVYLFGNRSAVSNAVNTLVGAYSFSYPKANIIRTNGSEFIETILRAVKNGNPQNVQPEKYLHDCDIFVFEDIDAVAGYMTTEQVLYGMLDWLLEHKVQAVITGSAPVSKITNMAQRIRTQIDGGISFRIL